VNAVISTGGSGSCFEREPLLDFSFQLVVNRWASAAWMTDCGERRNEDQASHPLTSVCGPVELASRRRPHYRSWAVHIREVDCHHLVRELTLGAGPSPRVAEDAELNDPSLFGSAATGVAARCVSAVSAWPGVAIDGE
jgi:hypothetical protein